MKKLITLFAIVISLTAFGQSEKDYFQSGIDKHKQQDYKGAIVEYSKAIKANKSYKDAYFNRGSCELALQDLKSAMSDFNKTIELDPSFAKAYYSRATVLVSQQKYSEALPDLNKTIELDATVPHAYTLRGQIRAQMNDKAGGCDDFAKAKANGDEKADKYISQFCDKTQLAVESLMLDWPDAEGWKVGDDQEDKTERVVDLVRSNETVNKWTELGNMTVIKGITGVPVDKAMNMMLDQAKQNSSKAKLTFIEKDENAEYPWIIFTIEAPGFKNDKTPESQLWYIVQGKQALYTNFRAVKQATISAEQKDKWVKFFKTGKIVTK